MTIPLPPTRLSLWPCVIPFLAWLVIGLNQVIPGSALLMALGISLMAAVVSAVHFAEVIAEKVGEPFGNLVLAVSVTIIEVGLILSALVRTGNAPSVVARDTIYATILLLLNGLMGLCLFVGAQRNRTQTFRRQGVSGSLAVIAVLSVATLILPSYTTTAVGPLYSPAQLGFVAAVSLALYAVFLMVQTVRHPDDFVLETRRNRMRPMSERPSLTTTSFSFVFLVVSLGAVVMSAKILSVPLSHALDYVDAPPSSLGVLIAIIVLLPESFSAIRAARNNDLQSSLNLTLNSVLATIGLTIPAVAVLSLTTGWPLPLGLDPKESVLLVLTLIVSTISLSTGKTSLLQGALHLVLFAIFLFVTVIP